MNKMYVAGLALPVCIGAVIAAQMVAIGLDQTYYTSWAFMFFMGAYLGRFLYLRSQGREAAFFSTRIRPTDAEERRFSTEWVALVGALFLIVVTVLLPVLRSPS